MPAYKAYGPHNAVAQRQKAFMSPTRRGYCSSDGSERFEFGICRTVFCEILGSVSETIIRMNPARSGGYAADGVQLRPGKSVQIQNLQGGCGVPEP